MDSIDFSGRCRKPRPLPGREVVEKARGLEVVEWPATGRYCCVHSAHHDRVYTVWFDGLKCDCPAGWSGQKCAHVVRAIMERASRRGAPQVTFQASLARSQHYAREHTTERQPCRPYSEHGWCWCEQALEPTLDPGPPDPPTRQPERVYPEPEPLFVLSKTDEDIRAEAKARGRRNILFFSTPLAAQLFVKTLEHRGMTGYYYADPDWNWVEWNGSFLGEIDPDDLI